MKKQDVDKGINAVHAAIDFISNATDSDETGIGAEMLDQLHELQLRLREDSKKLYDRGINARVRHILKKKKYLN